MPPFFFYVQGDSFRGNESLSFRFCGSGKIPLNDLQGTEKECRWTGHPISQIGSLRWTFQGLPQQQFPDPPHPPLSNSSLKNFMKLRVQRRRSSKGGINVSVQFFPQSNDQLSYSYFVCKKKLGFFLDF